MRNYLFDRKKKGRQYLISVVLVCCVALIGLLLHNLVGYRVVAFMLLVTVSILAMLLDILPVLLAALLSALIWDFFFIPPRFTFTVGAPEDRLLLLMYFLVACINGVLTFKIRQMEKEIRAVDEKANSVRFYDTLLNTLSHEMRTPITTIIGSTDNLLANSPQLSERDRSDLLTEISVASLRLNQQVENLLSMSRLESGFFQIKKDWCDINDLVYKTLQRLEANHQKHGVIVNIQDQLPLFKLDFGLMVQVLYNLLNNVSQHTPEGTIVTINAQCISDKLVITVSDNGNGFPENETDKVFNKFYRVKGSAPGGTGLGLSIVKGFVEAHRGNVKLESLPGRGAKFIIDIPTETSYVATTKNE